MKIKTLLQLFSSLNQGEKRFFSIIKLSLLLSCTCIWNGMASETINEGNTISQQEKRQITGVINDPQGEPIIGANIVEKGTTNGVVTDANGKFTLSVSGNAVLQISYVGYTRQEIEVKGKNNFSIVLREDSHGLDEVVVVGYGSQKKSTLTGAVSTVNSKDITVTPISNTANALTGRLPGLVTVQSEGRPGFDAASLNIRGYGSPLVIIDGVEGDLSMLNPNSIESISILKDGSASIYGARAGNGVLLVTTKRGGMSKPIFTFNASITGQGITNYPKKVSSGQYAEMRREAHIQSGQSPDTAPFSEEDIRKYYDGSDPRYFPNTDWFKELINNWAPQQEYNISVRGGNDRIKYYGFLGYLNQKTFWKPDGGGYRRYNLQSNVDMKLTNDLSMQVDVSSTIKDIREPSRSADRQGSLWQDLWAAFPMYLPRWPDPDKLPYVGLTPPIYASANRDISGYNDNETQRVMGTLSFNYEAPFIKGLSAKILLNYLKDFSKQKSFTKGYQMWEYSFEDDIYTPRGDTRGETNLSVRRWENRTLNAQFLLTYEKTINEDHHLKILGVYEGMDYRYDYLYGRRSNYLTTSIDYLYAGDASTATNDETASEMARRSYIGRINYSYKNKYLFETILRADASAKFASNNRWGYFPSVMFAWRISEESFMSNQKILDDLKLKLSFGQAGNDGVGNFQYLTGYQFRGNFGTYMFGDTYYQGLYSRGLSNPDLTWEEMSLYNVGVEYSILQRKIYGEVDVFYRERSKIPAKRNISLPNTFGAELPDENINSINDRGFDFRIGTAGVLQDFTWDASVILSWSRAKWDHYEEPAYEDPDQIRINKKSGKWTDITFGYKSDGLFTSQEEIDNLTFDQDQQGNKSLRPGDIKYIDVNNDGKLDWRDQVEIGKGQLPHWTLGFNISLTYKDFDFSALFQGAFGHYANINLTQDMSNYYDLRWTEANNDSHALVPRLGGAATNGYFSDYRFKSAGYLRLKTASLGYNLPKDLIGKVNLSQVRFFVSGTNLFTLDKLRKYGLDPEVPSISNSGSYYPQQRTISLGTTITF